MMPQHPDIPPPPASRLPSPNPTPQMRGTAHFCRSPCRHIAAQEHQQMLLWVPSTGVAR